jgi:uncharacterized membrane protein YuzA (DUF378 family)
LSGRQKAAANLNRIHRTRVSVAHSPCSENIFLYTHIGGHALASEKEDEMKILDIVAAVLVIVGALNWGLVAVANFDLVAALFGMQFGEKSALTAVVYALVGLAGLFQAVSWKGRQKRWQAQMAPARSR